MMNLIHILLRLIVIFPENIIYLLSDFLFFIVYKVKKYRVDIVSLNLKNSFPNLSPISRKDIEIAFYKNFCDILVENLIQHSFSKDELQRKMRLKNPEILNDIYDKNKSIMLVGAHYNNWEWMALSLSSYLDGNICSVYKPLSNKTVDKFMKNSRKRFGAKLVPMNSFVRTVLKNKNNSTVNLMLADQSPQKSKLDFFCQFLNQDTPIFLGPEKLIKSASLELNFIEVHRIKRGYYEMKVVPLLKSSEYKYGEITKLHASHLEKLINRNPQNWLWTHRRWKHSRKK